MSSIEASKVHVKKSLYKGQSNVMFWADSEMRFLKKKHRAVDMRE